MRIFALFLVLLCSFIPVRGALSATYQADLIPWSGYWWPSTAGGVVTGIGYEGHPAPLEKYDLATSGITRGPATIYGLQHYYDPQALSWEGLCFNWAAAAILEAEPVHKGIYEHTTFLVGDKKALLTVAYDGALCNTYPINDPADFHEVLEKFILNQRTPIMMDLGTDGEVWFYPVFKYETDYNQLGNIRHYTTTIYYASDGVRPDYTGTAVSTSTYYYYFQVDGTGNITGMGWEGDSIGRAPVRACEPFGTNPRNPGMDYNVVRQIVMTDDDAYEENDDPEAGVPVSTGAHNLIAMDDDFFYVTLKQGDRLSISIDSDTEDIIVRTYDPAGTKLDETSTEETQLIEAQEDGKYTLEVVSDDPVREYLYTLYVEHRLPFQAVFPIHPAGSWDTGISLLDSEGIGGRRIVSLFDNTGHPQKSYATNFNTSLLGLVEEDFGLSRAENGYIKIGSDSLLLGLEASMALDYLMLGANLMPLEDSSGVIFFPHFSNQGGWKTSFGLINTGDVTETVLRKSYGDEGQILQTQTLTLAPGERREEETAYTPILVKGARCMSAETLSHRASLLGYIKFLSPSSGSRGRALVRLKDGGDSDLVVPHVASGNDWWTGLALMNTGYDDSEILFTAYDDNGTLAASSVYLLRPKENLVKTAPDLFPGTPAESIASIRISSQGGEALCGLILYGTSSYNCLAGMPMTAPREFPLYLSHFASSDGWWTGIGLVNSGNETTSLSFSLFDEQNHILAERYWSLDGNARLAITIRDLFADLDYEGARFLKIDSMERQSVSAIYIMGTDDGQRIMGDVMQ